MKIGPYGVEERIGAGGMGEVFRAYDQRLGRRVALKQLRPGDAGADAAAAAGSRRRRARLRREAWSAAQISHPNLVQIYDILESPDGADAAGDWIVMEFVSGRTLAELAAGGPMPLVEAVRLARQVADGLAAAHARGVVHRDLKTENVMVTADGQAKILDFGLAKPVGAGDPATWTGTGAVVGTARAMSPEQARGRRVDFRTDLFSLGTLIYELVSGTSPFLAPGVATTLTRVCRHQPPPLSEVRDAVPDELSRLVEQLLQKIPEARAESAAAVASALAAIEAALDPQETDTFSGASETPSVADMETLVAGDDRPDVGPPSDLWQTRTGLSRIVRSHPLATLGGILVAALGVLVVALLLRSPEEPGRDLQATRVEVPATAFDALRRGDALLARHDRDGYVEQAQEAFDEALRLDPDYAPALAGKARASWRRYLAERDEEWLRRARDLARQAVDLDPQLLRARVALALVLAESGEYAEAESELRRLLRLDESNAEAQWALGRLQTLRGDPAAAAKSFERALVLDPEEAEYPFELAMVRQSQGDLDGAEELLQRSLRLQPDNAFALYSLGVVAYFRGSYAEAIRRFQRSIEIRPSSAAYSNIGTLYFFQGLYAEAVGALERAVRLGADDHVVWANLGDAYRWTEDRGSDAIDAYAQALTLLDRRLANHSGHPDLQSRRALILAKMGRATDSAEALEAMSKDEADWSGNANVVYRRAVAWELNGDRRRALAELARALEIGYPSVEAMADPELADLRADPRFEPAPPSAGG